MVELLSSADTRMMGFPTAAGMVAYWEGVAENPDSPRWESYIAAAFDPLHVVAVSKREEELDLDNAELLLACDDDELLGSQPSTSTVRARTSW